jgi:hypothetical protein
MPPSFGQEAGMGKGKAGRRMEKRTGSLDRVWSSVIMIGSAGKPEWKRVEGIEKNG